MSLGFFQRLGKVPGALHILKRTMDSLVTTRILTLSLTHERNVRLFRVCFKESREVFLNLSDGFVWLWRSQSLVKTESQAPNG